VHKTINVLLSTPKYNFFSLVRDPTQKTFDLKYTMPPVPHAFEFETGFLGYERAQIRDFVTKRISDDSARGGWLEPNMYILLDERSIDGEKTVVFGKGLSSLHDRDPDTMTEEEKDQWMRECNEVDYIDAPKDLWREYRVRFEEAENFATFFIIDTDFTQKLYNDEFVAEYTDERGVFQLAKAQHFLETFGHPLGNE
jgi:hypothetical protein